MSNFWGLIFSFFENTYCSVRTEKLHRIKVENNNFGKYFLQGKPQFFLGLKISM